MKIQLITQIWKEAGGYVAYIPQLDLSSCGRTVLSAQKNMNGALEAFIEESKEMGTLEQILEEAGFTHNKKWEAPKMIKSEKVEFAL